MPPKAKIPAPIDRPLSRAYLREFSGWSTAYPPGQSDPTSLRLMENMMVNRDGSIRVRPGLRYLSYVFGDTGIPDQIVGTHEAFFLNDGRKAYLFAVREDDGTVGFRVMDDLVVSPLTDFFFDIEPSEEALRFSPATKYVKYLQIDNKIFALSDAGEAMRLFYVGEQKRAKLLAGINRPDWVIGDKLTIVQPDADWITNGTPSWTRTNLNKNPSFETNVSEYTPGTGNTISRVNSAAGRPPISGSWLAKVDVASSTTMNVLLSDKPVTAGKTYRIHGAILDAGGGSYANFFIRGWTWSWRNSGGGQISTGSSVGYGLTSPEIVAPAGAVNLRITAVASSYGAFYLDAIVVEEVQPLATKSGYFDGSTPNDSGIVHTWTGTPHASTSTEAETVFGATIPTAETPTANTLISSTSADNEYNFGFFYTFSNEVGESAASQITVVRAQRPWSAWRWETPNSSGEPSGTPTADPTLVADQLVAYMPEAVFNAGMAQGATAWNLYMFTWSDQAPVPVTAVRVATKELTPDSVYGKDGWQRTTPVLTNSTEDYAALPNPSNRYNYSDPSRGGQGLVAADRMILVKDPSASAVIRWSSNQQGDYTNFSASKGGGYKTLTSGELQIPACVKLWQNPQSVDTLTILCLGTDSYSTGYYMAPAEVTSQSESTAIMSFEETTATPGTTSPYGCEVFNNALYHPLDDQLMKSTANNYNINHKSQTDQIRNVWEQLATKQWIVSSQHDNRLYYIVNNPKGAELEDGCNGNELWVYDAGADTGTWSRFLIQAHSLRRIERNGRIYMSVVRPDGIFYLDPEYDRDDYVDVADGRSIQQKFIPWMIETNTQGANRAHDAWCRLQNIALTLGNFQGDLRWGIKSWDVNGKPVDISKLMRDLNPPSSDGTAFDIDDYLLIRRDLKEWFFYASSVEDEDGLTARSFGQISYLQYRYAPVTVNVGYEYGSVETFEYGRASANWAERTTDNGVPQPYLDTRRP